MLAPLNAAGTEDSDNETSQPKNEAAAANAYPEESKNGSFNVKQPAVPDKTRKSANDPVSIHQFQQQMSSDVNAGKSMFQRSVTKESNELGELDSGAGGSSATDL